MRRTKWLALASVGVVAGSITLWATHATSQAQAPAATYKGVKMCVMCHKAKHPKIVDAWSKTGHSKALQSAADPTTVVAATFDANSPFKKDAVKWVLGKGIRAQAYIGADMKVLPAEWNVETKKWVPIAADDANEKCLGCHTTGYSVTTKSYTDPGVTCEGCHGPGSEHMAHFGNKAAITVLKNLPADRAQMICGRCHSRGLSTDKVHPFAVSFKPGDDLKTVFVDGKPTTPGRNQNYSEFVSSKHAAQGMTCATCHDGHGMAGLPNQLKKPINEQCLGCHAGTIKDMKTHAPSASADATCATCHMPSGSHSFKKPAAM